MDEDMAGHGTVLVDRSPSSSIYLVSFILTLPRELNEWFSVALCVATIREPSHCDEKKAAHIVVLKRDAGLANQIDTFGRPGCHFGDVPYASKWDGVGVHDGSTSCSVIHPTLDGFLV